MECYLLIGARAKDSGLYQASNTTEIKSIYHDNININKTSNSTELMACTNITFTSVAAHPILITVIAHGLLDHMNTSHYIELCNDAYTTVSDSHENGVSTIIYSYPYTKNLFDVFSKQNLLYMHIELLSCHGGAATKDIIHLPLHSTLMTIVEAERSFSFDILNELSVEITKASSLIKLNADDHFYLYVLLKFALYAIANPALTSFAINLSSGPKFFHASVDNADNYTVAGLKQWRNDLLLELEKFCHKLIKEESQLEEQAIGCGIHNQINSILEKTSLNSFTIERLQEAIFFDSVYNGDQSKIDILFQQVPNLNVDTIFDNTPTLITAYNTRNFDLVKDLVINKKANLNVCYEEGVSLLGMAIHRKDYDMAELLIKNKADVNLGLLVKAPLRVAACQTNTTIVEILIEAGADVNQAKLDNSADHPIPLITALYSHNTNVIITLLAYGADPTVRYNHTTVKELVHINDTKALQIFDLYESYPFEFKLCYFKERLNSGNAILKDKTVDIICAQQIVIDQQQDCYKHIQELQGRLNQCSSLEKIEHCIYCTLGTISEFFDEL